jgi:hypothetical protein
MLNLEVRKETAKLQMLEYASAATAPHLGTIKKCTAFNYIPFASFSSKMNIVKRDTYLPEKLDSKTTRKTKTFTGTRP